MLIELRSETHQLSANAKLGIRRFAVSIAA